MFLFEPPVETHDSQDSSKDSEVKTTIRKNENNKTNTF